ncbi:sirohydrochlorin cobaltochelatase [Austwickia chelonae]|uniref:precorrin-2 dehydrogenase n=1 Tax=Austwickia chelonae NBRC 105200 TaxID=1184607 RepID=K6ULA6_9MICO|nr:CbiX/SirB N-terminal domain-containing protein [Austwickia chelonae]GAB77081.1 putative sirohydrochlorin cobaltochelatase [Austwickia chelonae NBRC 105200]SEW33848.1 sirohydrochlorin cobaltochelatase [Austwickia chelonae]
MNEPATGHLPLVLAAHGTRDPEGVATCRAFVDRVRRHLPGVQVEEGYVELVEPPIADALADVLAARKRDAEDPRAVVVPLMVGTGCHVQQDIPEAIAEGTARVPGGHAAYGRPLGHDPRLLGVLRRRLVETAADWPLAETAVVLLGRGTKVPQANADHAALARLLLEDSGVATVLPAYIQVTSPSLPAALDQLATLGHRRIVVVPNFLFPGMLRTWTHQQSAAWMQDHPGVEVRVGEVIGDCDELAEVVAERYHEVAHECGTTATGDAPVYLAGLRLHGRTVLVVGGGHVAERRVPRLLEAGARVRIVSPELTPRLARLHRDGAAIDWQERTFVDDDLDGAWYALACTDDPTVNEHVVDVAGRTTTFCVRADAARCGTAWTPAVERAGGLAVAVVGDRDPRRSAQVRDALLRALHE